VNGAAEARIRPCRAGELATVLAVINEAAEAYRGVIPAECWHQPYMPAAELAAEFAAGVVFHLEERGGEVRGVMGIQDRGEVALVRHAYVRPRAQRQGIGTRLLRHCEPLLDLPVLIGTWAAADWAIAFYRRNGYTLLDEARKEALLRRYWTVPERQIATSVVLADRRWMEANGRRG